MVRVLQPCQESEFFIFFIVRQRDEQIESGGFYSASSDFVKMFSGVPNHIEQGPVRPGPALS